jgi:ATP-dependent DNA helicase RecG
VINALVHRDDSAYEGGVSLPLSPSRLEVGNLGSLPQGLSGDELASNHISRPHHPDLAHVFFLRGLIERIGIGARRIVTVCREAALPPPRWELKGGGVSQTLKLTPAGEKLPAHLNPRQRQFLRSVEPGQRTRVQEYHRRFAPAESRRHVQTDLAQLTDLGYLRREGSGPATDYVRTDFTTA